MLCFGGEVRLPGSQRIGGGKFGGGQAIGGQEFRECSNANSAGTRPQKLAAALDISKPDPIHFYSLVTNSSRFRMERPIPTQAACSTRSTPGRSIRVKVRTACGSLSSSTFCR